MRQPMSNPPMRIQCKPSLLMACHGCTGDFLSVIAFVLDAKKEKQKERQRRQHDTRHDHDKPSDMVSLDEASVIGEADRPMPPSDLSCAVLLKNCALSGCQQNAYRIWALRLIAYSHRSQENKKRTHLATKSGPS